MSVFSIFIGWAGQEEAGLQAFHSALADRPADDRWMSRLPGGEVVLSVRAVTGSAAQQHFVHVDAGRQWYAIGDVRLYDRDEVRLGLRQPCEGSDLELLFRTFVERGFEGIAPIRGDFAMVIWDPGARTIRAVRDQLGLRGLYFRRLPEGMALSSDVRPLLALKPAASERLDGDMVLDYILGDYAHHGRTFFQEINQVWPGYGLVADQGSQRQESYWRPPVETLERLTYDEMILEWRRLFEQAVACRLDSPFPTASYLSGGLDSGAIVGAAHKAYEASAGHRPPMFTLSALFPGTATDEEVLIRAAIVASPLFQSFVWDGTEINTDDLTHPHPVMPGLRQGMGRGPARDLEFIQRRDIRSVFSGSGGDELGWSHGYFKDLVTHGCLVELIHQMRLMPSWRGGLGHLSQSMTGLGWRRRPKDAPEWCAPALKDRFQDSSDDRRTRALGLDSHTQEESWRAIRWPHSAHRTDISRIVLGDVGAEIRLPYRDLRLVEFVMRIPWRLREPRGSMRRIQRDAVAPLLAPEVRRSRLKATAGDSSSRQLRGCFSMLREVLDGRTWVSGEYISQSGAKRAIAELQRYDPRLRKPGLWLPIWRIAAFEAWNRTRLGYNPPARMKMRSLDNLCSADGEHANSIRKKAYEPPALTPVGNVKDLLAGPGGISQDPDAPMDNTATHG